MSARRLPVALTFALYASSLWSCGGAPSPAPQSAGDVHPPAVAQPTDVAEGPAAARAVPKGRAATPAELRMVRELSREAERIRGLPLLRPVDVRVQDAAEMKQFVESQIDDAELEKARTRYVLLGLLAPDVDVRPLLLDLMEEQLVGYYDPERGALAIRDDVAASLQDASDPQKLATLRTVLLHELVHALQDQHFDLKSRLEEERTTDADAAVSAAIEGDATLAMIAFALEGSGAGLEILLHNPALLERMVGGGMTGEGNRLSEAPPVVREPLLFPYRDGALFAAALVRSGGWAAMDAVHRKPAPSGGHVLWPERYLKGQVPSRFDTGLPAALEAEGIEVVEEDELGPFEMGLFLEAMGGERAWSKKWVADHLWQLELEGQPALVWLLGFTGPEVARRVEATLEQQPAFQVSRLGGRILLTRNVAEPLTGALSNALLARQPRAVLDAKAEGN